MPTNGDNGEFRGATTQQILHLKEALAEVRRELRDITAALGDLRDFRSRVLAYAGIAAAAASFGMKWLMDRVGG